MTDLSQSGHELRRRTDDAAHAARDAVRTSAGFVAGALLFLLTAAVWMGTCTGATVDDLACGPASRSFLTVGAPVLLLVGAVVATRRGQRAHDDGVDGSPWLVASLTLGALTLVSAAVSWSALAG